MHTELTWRKTVSAGQPTLLYEPHETVSVQQVRVKNMGDEAIYVGASNVTSGTGYQLNPGEAETFTVSPHLGEALYAKTVNSAVSVHCTKGTA